MPPYLLKKCLDFKVQNLVPSTRAITLIITRHMYTINQYPLALGTENQIHNTNLPSPTDQTGSPPPRMEMKELQNPNSPRFRQFTPPIGDVSPPPTICHLQNPQPSSPDPIHNPIQLNLTQTKPLHHVKFA